jgi:tetratricopeptide (TPR) repeat protein
MKTVTARHVKYAHGYIGLGLLNEASDELEEIEASERFLPEVLAARLELHWEGKHWHTLVSVARQLVGLNGKLERAWIAWAYALRELGQVEEAKAVLLEAEPLHGTTSAVLHYNLGCYHCLLGEKSEARLRLKRAFRMHPPFQEGAIHDPDLAGMRDELKVNG